jgi:hypothetical protein
MIMRPKQFYFVAAIMLLIALSFPIQAMLLYGHSWTEWGAILQKITWLNALVMLTFTVSAYFYFHASRVVLYLAPVLLVLVALNNYWVGQYAGDFSMLQTSLGTLAVAFLFAPLTLPSSKVVLRDPKRRWWRRSKRINKRVATTLNPYVGDMITAHTFDVSETGAFLCLNEEQTELPRVGDTVRISFNVSAMKKIRCEAIVVRITEARGHYPRGMGIKFVDMDRIHEKKFSEFLSN